MYVCMLCKHACMNIYLVNGRGSPVSRPVSKGGVNAAVDVRQANVMEIDMKRWIQRLHNALLHNVN